MLLERGEREVRLSRKAFALLRVLIANRARVVTKAELHAQLWPDTFVVDANLNVLVLEIRRALDDPARDEGSFSGPCTVWATVLPHRSSRSRAGSTPDTARCWLVAGDEKYAVRGEDATIGRDPACDVWLDAPGVSRWHARIRIGANGDVTLEDNNSTNGTYLGKSRIAGPARLRDGDEVHFGSLALTFRTRAAAKETERVRPPA